MNRRTLLATTGTTIGTALGGCLGGSGAPAETTTAPDPAEKTTDTATTTTNDSTTSVSPTEGVAVSDIGVLKALRYESMMGSGGVHAKAGKQFVVASVRADGELSESVFTFETDDRSWKPGLPDSAGAMNRTVAGRKGGPIGRGPKRDRSYLAFTVPSPLSASNPRIQYAGSDSARWSLPTKARDRLAASAPRFELESLEVPDEVSQGTPLSVSFTAKNVSETDGQFLAALYWPTKRIADDDESRVVERQVSAGDAVTISLDIDTSYTTSEAESVTLSIRGHVSAEREVQVRDISGTS